MDYEELRETLCALLQKSDEPVSCLANAAALLYQSLPEVSWAGFYLLRGDRLFLGPFQGKPACVTIPLGRGVCGTAAAENRVQRVPDVERFPGHIVCDAASRSELVIPLHSRAGRVTGVLDLDSTRLDRFTEADAAGLEAAMRAAETRINWEVWPGCPADGT